MAISMRRCVICGRRSEGTFCSRHQRAYESLRRAYKEWRMVLGDISWSEYLAEFFENRLSGRWVKKVIAFLREKRSSLPGGRRLLSSRG